MAVRLAGVGWSLSFVQPALTNRCRPEAEMAEFQLAGIQRINSAIPISVRGNAGQTLRGAKAAFARSCSIFLLKDHAAIFC